MMAKSQKLYTFLKIIHLSYPYKMKRYITLLLLFAGLAAFSQQSAEAEVKKTIEKFFDGFHKGDTLIIKATLHDKLIMQTAYKNKKGEDVLNQDNPKKFLNAIATRPADQKWDERLQDFIIKVDGNMANAWTPYEFWFNGKFSHCGVNSFQLFNDAGTWKIIYLIDTRRRAGCGQ